MALTIERLRAHQILDSQGNPTLAVHATLSNGVTAQAQVPSGASTGRHEAVELRDADPRKYSGKGVLRAAGHVNSELNELVRGRSADDLASLDKRMIEADGTQDKSRLGANALLGVSCAIARALSVSYREPLWRTLARTYDTGTTVCLPIPMVNILSGGLHANRNIEFQDFLAIAHGYETFAESLHAIVQVHRTARDIIEERRYVCTGVADEGGWGPVLPNNRVALEILTAAIERAGQRPLEQMSIALDVASSHFYENGCYRLDSENRRLTSAEIIQMLTDWCDRYPITSIEDALAEDDWTGWRELTRALGARVQLVGDDFFTTNPQRVRRGIEEGAANAVLVKMNQIGTLTETFEVLALARRNDYRCVVSARSGETEDSFLADLATAAGSGQIKVGSITRSERLAKYNRLLEIEGFEGLAFGRVQAG